MTTEKPQRRVPTRRIEGAADPFGMSGVVLSDDGLFIGNRNGGVSKRDRLSLENVWTSPGEHLAPVAVQDTVVLVASSDGLCGIDERIGSKLWGPLPVGPCVKWSQRILALRPPSVLDVRQGLLERTLNLPEEILGDPFVAGDLLVGTSLKGDPVTAFDLLEERVVWKKRLFTEINVRANRSEPARIVWAGDDVFLVGRTDMLAGCSLAEGMILWETAVGVPYYLPDATAGHAYILVAGDTLPARFVSVEARTGRKVYDIPQPSLHLGDRPFGGTFVREEIVFCTTRGLVIAFRLEDGSTSWWHRSQERLAPAIAVDRRVLVPTREGSLLVFEPDQ